MESRISAQRARARPMANRTTEVIALDTDLLDFVCGDNEKDVPHLTSR
jgi:hypothetical protein